LRPRARILAHVVEAYEESDVLHPVASTDRHSSPALLPQPDFPTVRPKDKFFQ
jgi:hypothetical protein